MARPAKKKSPEIPGYWKPALDQRVRDRLGSGSAGAATAPKRKRRRVMFARWITLALLFGGVAALCVFAWNDFAPVSEKAPVGVESYELRFKTDGVIAKERVKELISPDGRMPPIFDAKRKIEEIGQVRECSVHRADARTLVVTLSERTPVGSFFAFYKGVETLMCVSSAGVIYEAENMGGRNSPVLRNLPLITDTKPVREVEGGPHVIPGFAPIAGFLDFARRNHKEVYRDWKRVSLAKYAGRPDAPGALIIVYPVINLPPDSPKLDQIVFSPVDYTQELRTLADPPVYRGILNTLRVQDRVKYPSWRLDLSLVNASTPASSSEYRLIPIPAN